MGENRPLNGPPSYPKQPELQVPEPLLRKSSYEQATTTAASESIPSSKSFQRVREPPEKPILYASPYLQNRKLSFSDPNSRSSYQQQHPPPPPPPPSYVHNGGPADYSSTSSEEEESSSGSLYRSAVLQNRLQLDDTCPLDTMEHLYEDRAYRGSNQAVMRLHASPFANIGKNFSERVPRSAIFPSAQQNYPTFLCTRCGTRQREFFTVENVAGQLEGPGSYLALYFFIYVMCSLFIFGLEEGWMPLDCIYFAVITLTTAGLGDFVPTSGANKIICSVFIYFGVACIGLLLGSYIAGMLDDKAYRESKQKQIDSCPNCAKLKLYRESAIREERRSLYSSLRNRRNNASFESDAHNHSMERTPTAAAQSFRTPSMPSDGYNSITSPIHEKVPFLNQQYSFTDHHPRSPYKNNNPLLGSPVTRQILGRQSHTRHISFDVGSNNNFAQDRSNNTSFEQQLRGSAPSGVKFESDYSTPTDSSEEDSSILSSSTYSSHEEGVWDAKKGEIQNAKYVFLTLRKALVNSMVIIAVGCVGFILIEDFDPIDSWYFTTVLLTTVGYGDIVPTTKGGKLFATIYILVAGTILLNHMSTISMIPLELRRRRIEKAVLTQFGEHLDDEALHELATGPLVQRLKLSTNRSDGLNECTREMFSLAMLVRLGKVTEEDIRETFTAFGHLDVNKEGVLNSKSIIGGMIKQHRTTRRNVPPPPPDYHMAEQSYGSRMYWYGTERPLPVAPDLRSSNGRGATSRNGNSLTEHSPLVP